MVADILLFGATGYTGRLTAEALADAGASFALAGRNHSKLRTVSERVGKPDIHIVDAQDLGALVRALDGCKVLITTVGPFARLGETAVRAALQAGVHYVDSTGEGTFIDLLGSDFDEAARKAGSALAPAMGFDEVPGDVVCAMAAEGMERPDVTVTYAVGRSGSAGTVRSAIGIVGSTGPWIEKGRERRIRAGEERRWAPLPPPVGPSHTCSFPFALSRLAPLHLDPDSFRTFIKTSTLEAHALRLGAPMFKAFDLPPFARLLDLIKTKLPEGPTADQRADQRWMLLAEASSRGRRRNVVATGTDVYGLTARTLAAAAAAMTAAGYQRAGLMSPVQAVGLQLLRETLTGHGVDFEFYSDD